MPVRIELKFPAEEVPEMEQLLSLAASNAGYPHAAAVLMRKSIDARRSPLFLFAVDVYPAGEEIQRVQGFRLQNVAHCEEVHIVGMGPAGIFAAMQLIELGYKPVILERGKDVRRRRFDLADLVKNHQVNEDSNYCFGEGGAGTYSDGKLYTRSSKRGNVQRILQIFHQLGAPDAILYQSHPHIGTNLLPRIITAMRQEILHAGGQFLFDRRVTDLVVQKEGVKEVIAQTGERFSADAVILATGHSARDIFELFHQHNWQLEAKPFALGVRIEHTQGLIDSIQYHAPVRNPVLPPASYSLVEQVNTRGVFSFCMCPGGIIAPAATEPGELVVNGWSPSKRNHPYANSGLVVQVGIAEALQYFGKQAQAEDPLLLMHFQQAIEQKAFLAGGGQLVAPAQRMTDFVRKRISNNLPNCSYIPGTSATNLDEVLPPFISDTLREGCKLFGKKMKGYLTEEAIMVATESRTSAPVRIPRDDNSLTHPQLSNLYPCGEGAGYAGGIISAAMDGEKVADAIASVFA
jgi:uncharacterized FAD-dependent dehydrogenase